MLYPQQFKIWMIQHKIEDTMNEISKKVQSLAEKKPEPPKPLQQRESAGYFSFLPPVGPVGQHLGGHGSPSWDPYWHWRDTLRRCITVKIVVTERRLLLPSILYQ